MQQTMPETEFKMADKASQTMKVGQKTQPNGPILREINTFNIVGIKLSSAIATKRNKSPAGYIVSRSMDFLSANQIFENDDYSVPTVGEISHSERTYEDGLSVRQSNALLSPYQLLERLAQVNKGNNEFKKSSAGVVQNSAVPSRLRPRRDLTIQDLTQILRHVNRSEDSGVAIQWNDIFETAYENFSLRACHNQARKCSSVMEDEILSIQDIISPHTLLETNQNELSKNLGFEESLTLKSVYNETSSGCTLNASIHSCSSSITWDTQLVEEFVEISITDDEDNARLDELLGFEDEEDFDDSSSVAFEYSSIVF